MLDIPIRAYRLPFSSNFKRIEYENVYALLVLLGPFTF